MHIKTLYMLQNIYNDLGGGGGRLEKIIIKTRFAIMWIEKRSRKFNSAFWEKSIHPVMGRQTLLTTFN